MEKSRPVIGVRPLFTTSIVNITSSPGAACSGLAEKLKERGGCVCVAVGLCVEGEIVSFGFCVKAGVEVAEGSSVADGARVSEGIGVVSLVAASEGVGISTFVGETVGGASCSKIREDVEIL